MAVEPWDLRDSGDRPELRLVEADRGAPSGRPFQATLFVLFVALAVGTPSIATALQAEPEVQRWVPRPQPATAVTAIDPVTPVPRSGRPASDTPFAGILFVRCTRLWSALPDGSHPRKVLEMPGISSPAIAPNARTTAFFVATAQGQELWMSGVDGTDPRRIGALAQEGSGLLSRGTALTWSPQGDKLAFALVDGRYAPFEGGAAIWTLDLTSGEFSRQGSGWPAPFWAEHKLAWASISDADWAQFEAPMDWRNWLVRNTRTSKHDLAAALVPGGYSSNHKRGAAVFRVAGDRPLLIVKDLYRKRLDKRDVKTGPPEGYAFDEHARPSISQNGSSVAIDLLDGAGERDLGIFDTAAERWTVLDYAWEAASSPAPSVAGSLEARRAFVTVTDLMDSWNARGTRRNLLVEGADRNAFPFARRAMGYIPGKPVRVAKGWSVPVVVNGFRGDLQWWQAATIVVAPLRQRLTADVILTGELSPLRTIADAMAFTETALGRDLAAPSLPAGSELQRNSVYGYNYGADAQITFNAQVPFESEQGLKKTTLGFGFGDDLDLSMGCGDGIDGEAIALGGTPAVIGSSAGSHQVIWPSTLEDQSGDYTVHGSGLPKERIVEIARSMAVSTP